MRYSMFLCIAVCCKRLGKAEKCGKEFAKAYHPISVDAYELAKSIYLAPPRAGHFFDFEGRRQRLTAQLILKLIRELLLFVLQSDMLSIAEGGCAVRGSALSLGCVDFSKMDVRWGAVSDMRLRFFVGRFFVTKGKKRMKQSAIARK